MKDEKQLYDYLLNLKNNKQYQLGLDVINENEHLIEKKYYDITRLKIEFLISLNKYMDALLLIKQEKNVPYIPLDFEKFLNDNYDNISRKLNDKKTVKFSYEDIENIDQLDEKSLLMILPRLSEFNLIRITNQLQNILDSDNISNYIKTLLIAALSDYKLDYNFKVIKDGVTIKFNPSTVFDIRNGENYLYIQSKINKIGLDEYNVINLISRLTIYYLLDIYPLIVDYTTCDLILTSAIYLVNQMLSIDVKWEKYDENITNDIDKVNKICKKINYLLETI
ncbi:MAG: hypothetical protein MR270_00620 [Erysipelotrichaceae bacterium]|nr:hypothetical protein [Erysipelotrichaceae bacterium]